jgi:tetratricopeptide (TPR) repeat protein
MARLTLCLIARNEAVMLPELLESVVGVVDEIVLVDTGSTDDTVALAQAVGATVVHERWADDFAHPRNTALAHAHGDWVLQLDADERLGPGVGEVLRRLLQRDPGFDCGLVALHNAATLDAAPAKVVSGEARLSEVAWLPRLIRRVPGLRYSGVIHESVLEFVAERDLTIARVPGVDVVHLGAVPELRVGKGKRERNVALLRKRCELEPDSVLPWGYLALELIQEGRDAEAQPAIETGWALVAAQPKHRSVVRLAVARGLAQLGRNDGDGLLDTVRVATRHEGEHPDLLFLAGCGHEVRGEMSKAVSCFSRCLDPWPVELSSFIGGSTGWNAAARLGSCLSGLGRWAEAKRAFARALALKPGLEEAQLGLVEVSLGLAAPAQALHDVQGLLNATPDGWLLAAHAAVLLGAKGDARLFFTRAVERSGTPLLARHRAVLAASLDRVLRA